MNLFPGFSYVLQQLREIRDEILVHDCTKETRFPANIISSFLRTTQNMTLGLH
jgi:hypothetical protein